uniref:Uncharacterized protein n=1 Tax=Physcomitrium patens TaxID=3218 RepID=A0A7I4FCP9_PHYPA
MVEWTCQQNGRTIICRDQHSVCHTKVSGSNESNNAFGHIHRKAKSQRGSLHKLLSRAQKKTLRASGYKVDSGGGKKPRVTPNRGDESPESAGGVKVQVVIVRNGRAPVMLGGNGNGIIMMRVTECGGGLFDILLPCPKRRAGAWCRGHSIAPDMLWSITEHHRARGVFELWKSLPETARRAFAAEFSSGGASNAEPCGPSDYSRQCELRSGHLEAVGVRSEAVAPTLCKSRGGSLEVRYEVNCWVLSHKGRFPAYAFCEKRGGGISMYDSLNGSLQNPLLMRMPPSVLDEFPSTPGKLL